MKSSCCSSRHSSISDLVPATLPPMSEGKKKASSVLVAILIAAVLSLIVSLVRLYGEVQGWAPTIFSTEAGGGGSPLGITWLVLVFGFWFGRRLARDGSRPRSTLLAFVLPIVGIVITMVTFMLVLGAEDRWDPAGRRSLGVPRGTRARPPP